MKTPQEIFDIVAAHLLTQNAKSEVPNPNSTFGTKYMCAYRGNEGRKCAAGVLIQDAAYYPSLEGKRVNADGVEAALRASLDPDVEESDKWGEVVSLISSLQTVHDMRPPDEWAQSLVYMANKNGLDPKVIFATQRITAAADQSAQS